MSNNMDEKDNNNVIRIPINEEENGGNNNVNTKEDHIDRDNNNSDVNGENNDNNKENNPINNKNNNETNSSNNNNDNQNSGVREMAPFEFYTNEEVIAALPPYVAIPTSKDFSEMRQNELDDKFEDYFVALYTASEWMETGYESRRMVSAEDMEVEKDLADRKAAKGTTDEVADENDLDDESVLEQEEENDEDIDNDSQGNKFVPLEADSKLEYTPFEIKPMIKTPKMLELEKELEKKLVGIPSSSALKEEISTSTKLARMYGEVSVIQDKMDLYEARVSEGRTILNNLTKAADQIVKTKHGDLIEIMKTKFSHEKNIEAYNNKIHNQQRAKSAEIRVRENEELKRQREEELAKLVEDVENMVAKLQEKKRSLVKKEQDELELDYVLENKHEEARKLDEEIQQLRVDLYFEQKYNADHFLQAERIQALLIKNQKLEAEIRANMKYWRARDSADRMKRNKARTTAKAIRRLADKARAKRKMEEEKLEKIKIKFEADMKTMKDDQAKFEKVHGISARRIQIEKERVRAMAASEYYRYNDVTPTKEVIDKLVEEYEEDFKNYSQGRLAKEVERLASDNDMRTLTHSNQLMVESDEEDNNINILAAVSLNNENNNDNIVGDIPREQVSSREQSSPREQVSPSEQDPPREQGLTGVDNTSREQVFTPREQQNHYDDSIEAESELEDGEVEDDEKIIEELYQDMKMVLSKDELDDCTDSTPNGATTEEWETPDSLNRSNLSNLSLVSQELLETDKVAEEEYRQQQAPPAKETPSDTKITSIYPSSIESIATPVQTDKLLAKRRLVVDTPDTDEKAKRIENNKKIMMELFGDESDGSDEAQEGDSKEEEEKKKRRRVKRGIICSLCFEENSLNDEFTPYCKAKNCHGKAHERCREEDEISSRRCKYMNRSVYECFDDSAHDFTFVLTDNKKSLVRDCLLCSEGIQENEKLHCVSCSLTLHKECWEQFAYQFYTEFQYMYCSLDCLLKELDEDGLMNALAEINCDYKIEGEDGKVISEVRAYRRSLEEKEPTDSFLSKEYLQASKAEEKQEEVNSDTLAEMFAEQEKEEKEDKAKAEKEKMLKTKKNQKKKKGYSGKRKRKKATPTKRENTPVKKGKNRQKPLQTTEDELANIAYKNKSTASSSSTTTVETNPREQDPPSEQLETPREQVSPREQKVSREQVSSREQDVPSEQPEVSKEQPAPREQPEKQQTTESVKENEQGENQENMEEKVVSSRKTKAQPPKPFVSTEKRTSVKRKIKDEEYVPVVAAPAKKKAKMQKKPTTPVKKKTNVSTKKQVEKENTKKAVKALQKKKVTFVVKEPEKVKEKVKATSGEEVKVAETQKKGNAYIKLEDASSSSSLEEQVKLVQDKGLVGLPNTETRKKGTVSYRGLPFHKADTRDDWTAEQRYEYAKLCLLVPEGGARIKRNLCCWFCNGFHGTLSKTARRHYAIYVTKSQCQPPAAVKKKSDEDQEEWAKAKKERDQFKKWFTLEALAEATRRAYGEKDSEKDELVVKEK